MPNVTQRNTLNSGINDDITALHPRAEWLLMGAGQYDLVDAATKHALCIVATRVEARAEIPPETSSALPTDSIL